MVDLRVFLAGRMAFDSTLNETKLLDEFLETYYGGGLAAGHVKTYIGLVSTAFASANASEDFAGRPLDEKTAKIEQGGPLCSAFRNDTLLVGAKHLSSALKATNGVYRSRISYDLMHLQYVLLIRWEQLRAYATAMEIPWPVHDSKQAEFQAFAAECVFVPR